jgi:mercuric ion transport protein
MSYYRKLNGKIGSEGDEIYKRGRVVFDSIGDCPCHLVLLIPLLAGTALGAYLVEFERVAFGVLVLFFVILLYIGCRKMFPTKKADDCCSVER